MATKTIRLTSEAYEVLANLQGRGQSFSEVIVENLPKARTCGDLLHELERHFEGAKLFVPKRIEQIHAGRGRRRLAKRL
jgi:predicted CopG family antitoxin